MGGVANVYKFLLLSGKMMGLFWGEKEGAVKGNRLEQMQAVESWALSCYRESKKDNPNLDEILENLRKINLQERKIWSNSQRIKKRSAEGLPIGIPSGRGEYTKYISTAVRYGARPKKGSTNIPLEYDMHLNELGEDPDWMVKKITEVRATAVVTLRDIKKEKKLSLGSKRNIRLLSSLATQIAELKAKWEKSQPTRSY